MPTRTSHPTPSRAPSPREPRDPNTSRPLAGRDLSTRESSSRESNIRESNFRESLSRESSSRESSREPARDVPSRDLPSRRERLQERTFERTHSERPPAPRSSPRPTPRPTQSPARSARVMERGAQARRRAAARLESLEPKEASAFSTSPLSSSRSAGSRAGSSAGEWDVLDFEAALRSRRPSARALDSASSALTSPRDFAPHVEEKSLPRERVRKSCPPCHWGLMVLSLLLCAFSIPLVYSASTAIALDHHGRPDFFLLRQIGYATVGALLLLATSRLSSRGLRVMVWCAYAIALVGLFATDFSPFGNVMGGVKRWVKVGPVQFQFSELAKIALIGVMADYWSRAGRNAPNSLGPWVVTAVLSLPIVGLVFLQPHLSAAVLLFLLPFCIAFYAGASVKSIAKIALPILALAIVAISLCVSHKMPGLKEYQQERIAAHFGGGGSDEQGSNYQSLQGQSALMRGGLLGSGPGASLYKQGHLPAPHTDFILAVTGEEWGLLGMTVLLGAYGLMIFFCFHAGHCASSPFEALLCAGVGTLLGVQVVCNVGVVTGMLPVTGMPLPLLSFGGSGMLCTLLGLGLVLSVTRRFNCERDKSPAI